MAFMLVCSVGCSANDPRNAAPASSVGTGAGTVVIDGERFEFVATTCLAEAQDVVAQGPAIGDGGYFVTVDSGGQVSVAFGVSSGTEDPDANDPLFQSVERAEFLAGETEYTARVSFVDTHGAGRVELNGEVTLRCDKL